MSNENRKLQAKDVPIFYRGRLDESVRKPVWFKVKGLGNDFKDQ